MKIYEKVLSCFGNVDAKSTAKMCGCSQSQVYNIWHEHCKLLSELRTVCRHPNHIPTPFKFIKDKLEIRQGASCVGHNIPMEKCALWMTEYVNKYYR